MKVKMKAVSKVTGFSGAAACARSSMTVKYWVIVPTEHVRLSLSSDVLIPPVRTYQTLLETAWCYTLPHCRFKFSAKLLLL